MHDAVLNNNAVINLAKIPVLTQTELEESIRADIQAGYRPIAFFGHKIAGGVQLIVIMANDPHSQLLCKSTIFKASTATYPALTNISPAFHYFEREFFEDTGIMPEGHPWLKPVRRHSGGSRSGALDTAYPFYSIDSENVHEVAVGPVHAGVIEPGHFRFICTGETVRHLEIQLGYQHRGIEKMFTLGDGCSKYILAESITGDSCIANTTAYVSALENAAGIKISARVQAVRAIAQEIERIALHLNTFSGLCGDIADLTGNAFWGATRTYAINALQSICGNRFGRGLIRPGTVTNELSAHDITALQAVMQLISERVDVIGERTFKLPGLLARFQRTGIIDYKTAAQINMVGPAGRASGVKLDVRADHSYGHYKYFPPYKLTLDSGDIFARAYMRYLEIQRSLRLIMDMLDGLPQQGGAAAVIKSLPPESMTVSMVEGPRGEIIHILITGSNGEVIRYKIKDASFNNWFALGLAMRNEGISDFPICNKSFDLSYCGHDL